ncbi:unnamed protein product [Eruca vesicaria subsp. sativa]|uniref:Uncharacterized protein n=1 Tax=Eruca vesicaria subsp. sativa TaxID=29727 RepID=A0ABC8KR52_ERUVS|nr:unnamed protein product [Eruca vesicaria subsp. sativa]
MTGTSDKSGKKNKGLPLGTVKDEFASSSKSKGNTCLKIEHEILKENHETLKIDYASLQKRVKLSEETYEVMKKLLQSKTQGLEVKSTSLEEDCVRVRSERDKYKKMFEEMKTVESDRKAKIDELRKREEELLLATRRGKEDAEKLKNKFVALAERFGVIEADCSYLKALYDAEVAATGLGGTVNLIAHHQGNNDATDSTMITDEHNDPPRETNISTQRSFDRRSQEDQCKNQEISTPRAVTNHLLPFSASPSSSSSSSSSDGYDVVLKRPANWPEWAMPKGPGDGSNKS